MKIRETHRIIVLGAGGVGKTSLVHQFQDGFFSPQYKPTVEDYYRHTIQLPDGIFHTVEILDTSGTHYFPAMRELSIRSGRAFILVFSVDSLQSFHEVLSLWELVIKIRGNLNVPIVLVGNKADPDCIRQVSYETVEETKRELMNNCPYIETSAKYNKNVARLFMELLLQARALDGSNTPEMKRRGRKLSRRLSSFGSRCSSLPNITLRRKSSSNSQKLVKNASEDGAAINKNQLNKTESFDTANGNLKSTSSSTTGSISGNMNRTIGMLSGSANRVNGSRLINSSLKRLSGLNGSNPMTGSLNGVNKIIDNDISLEIKRAIINGMDTISLSDGSKTPPDQRCTIL